jgi:hypothetical protein
VEEEREGRCSGERRRPEFRRRRPTGRKCDGGEKHREERFESDAEALRIFKVASRTDVRGEWLHGKLASFVAAGMVLPMASNGGGNG